MLTILKTKISERCEDLERTGRIAEMNGLEYALRLINKEEEEEGETAVWNAKEMIAGCSLLKVMECSHCKMLSMTKFKYCPECGARMEDVK